MSDWDVTKTERGFELVEFADFYEEKCSLQQSSLATGDCIWLGVSAPYHRVLASQAESIGIERTQENGWQDYPLPIEVSVNGRMHLHRKQVEVLVSFLQNWLENGSFSEGQ